MLRCGDDWGRCRIVWGAHTLFYTSPHTSSHLPQQFFTTLISLLQHFPIFSHTYSGAATMLLMLLFLIFYSPLACYVHRFVASSLFSCSPIILFIIFVSYIILVLTVRKEKTNYLLHTKISRFSHFLPN